jgi:hypothetical protein
MLTFIAVSRPYSTWRIETRPPHTSTQQGAGSSLRRNRSYGNHRLSENDTSTSGSSLAHQYAVFDAKGGRVVWAKHRQDSSMDSVMSDYSVAGLGRPDVGDKMFDTA